MEPVLRIVRLCAERWVVDTWLHDTMEAPAFPQQAPAFVDTDLLEDMVFDTSDLPGQYLEYIANIHRSLLYITNEN